MTTLKSKDQIKILMCYWNIVFKVLKLHIARKKVRKKIYVIFLFSFGFYFLVKAVFSQMHIKSIEKNTESLHRAWFILKRARAPRHVLFRQLFEEIVNICWTHFKRHQRRQLPLLLLVKLQDLACILFKICLNICRPTSMALYEL